MVTRQRAFKSRGILIKLLFLVLIPVVPAATLAFYHNLQNRKTELNRLREGVDTLSRVIATSVHSYTRNTEQLLYTVAEFSPLVLGTNAQFSAIHLENLLKISPDYVNFGLIETNGLLFVDGVRGDRAGLDFSDRAYFQRAIQSKRFAVGNYQIGRLSGRPSLNFGIPVFKQTNEIQRIFFAALDLNLFKQAAESVELPEGATATILDREGTIMARVPHDPKFLGASISASELGRSISKEPKKFFEAVGLDGVKRLYALTSVSDSMGAYAQVLIGVPTELLFLEANLTLLGSLGLLSLITVAAMLASYLFAQRVVVQPVNHLITAAEELAAGNYAARAAAPSGEFKVLAAAFNKMADNLATREEALRTANATITTLNAGLERTVAERTAELTATNQELEAFTYSVSHDLRAPLRHMDGFAQLLTENQKDRLDEKGQRHLKIISDSAKRMGALIDDLLTFSRMGRQELVRSTVDTSALVRDVAAMVEPRGSERPVEWRIAPLPQVQGDAALLRQVWINLLANAVKYSSKQEKPIVEVGVDETDADHIFFIKDNGAGFDMKYADKLFGVFQRLHSDKEFEGTGIGLAIVRRIVTRHGGRAWANSVLGEGATFYFSIPKHETRTRPAAPR